ncbi:hypothetical protein JFT95_06720 [Bacillus sp. TH17]|nr:hypothetical protein [Bacillus sp. TH17]
MLRRNISFIEAHCKYEEKVSRFIFLPIWFFLCVLGLIVFTREWKNNRIFSISIGFLSFIPH